MLSLYFCRAVRVDCPASLYKEKTDYDRQKEKVMSIYGYCRISTAKQSIDRQIRNIKAAYPTAHIV